MCSYNKKLALIIYGFHFACDFAEVEAIDVSPQNIKTLDAKHYKGYLGREYPVGVAKEEGKTFGFFMTIIIWALTVCNQLPNASDYDHTPFLLQSADVTRKGMHCSVPSVNDY